VVAVLVKVLRRADERAARRRGSDRQTLRSLGLLREAARGLSGRGLERLDRVLLQRHRAVSILQRGTGRRASTYVFVHVSHHWRGPVV